MSDLVKYQIPFNELPEGTVTFLFTDIEGSTQLLSQLRDQYASLLADQRRILRKAFANWHGQEVDTQGDAFFIAFPRATQAVSAAVEIQRALNEHKWPENVEVRVRVGLHTGEPLKVVEGYVGMDVHRAARIAHVGHGGQVLLSETTAALVIDELPDGVQLLDLGRHLLKDMRRPEHVRQLVIKGLPSEFPPLTSLAHLPPVELREPRQIGECPYRGLAAFREGDAQFFYGREIFTERLESSVKTKPLVAVIVGSSGSGKSSVVFAGLLPRLRQAGSWQIAVTRPGDQPFYSLASTLSPLLAPELGETDQLVETRKLAERLTSGEVNLYRVVERVLEKGSQVEQILLVIDQFEELYTLCPDVATRQRFIDELLATEKASSERRPSPIVSLLTMRADFMGQALSHRPFADALQDVSLILGPMNQEELRTAIEKPAQVQGAAFEPGLVERILDDVGREPGNLPLLEFALTLLWERQSDGWLTHEDYEVLGCVQGALASYADEVYAGLDESEREAAHQIFVQLVRPGEGTEDTRRLATYGELGAVNWGLIQYLADKRLVVTGRDASSGGETVDVVHEALIQRWGQLRTWMSSDRAFRTWQERLRGSMHAWHDSGRDEGALLRGVPLALALEWRNDHEQEMSEPENEFIEASQEESQRRTAEEEARRERELETAQQLAETEHARAEEQAQSAARLRRRAIFLGAVLVVAAVLAVAAVLFARQSNQNATLAKEREALALDESYQRATAEAEALAAQEQAQTESQTRATAEAVAIAERDNAEEQRDLTRSRELGLEAAAILYKDPELSMLLALQGLASAYTKEAEQTLHQGVLASRLRMHLIGETSATIEDVVRDLALSTDGSRIATADSSGFVNVWDAVSGENLLVQTRDGEHFRSLAFSPDGKQLALTSRVVDITTSRSEDAELRLEDAGTSKVVLWDASSGNELAEIILEGESAEGVTFSQDGNRIAVTTMSPVSRSLRVFDATLGEEQLSVSFDLGGYFRWNFEPAFSPDGGLIAIGLGDGTARVLEAATGEELQTFIHTTDPWDQGIRGVAFDPEGKRLAVTGVDKILSTWDLETGDQLFKVDIEWPTFSAYSPDGRLIVAHYKVFDSETGEVLFSFPNREGREQVAFSPDGERLVTDGIAHDVKVWDISPSAELWTTPVTYAEGLRLVVSPGGEYIATGDDSGRIALLEAASGEQLWAEQGHEDWVGALSFNEDGTRLATGADDGTVVIWDVVTGITQTQWTAHDTWLNNCALSPDGDRLATSSHDQSIKMWDISTGEVLWTQTTSGPVLGMSMDTAGKLLASGTDPSGTTSPGGTISLWDFESGEKLGEWVGPQYNLTASAFSPDGEVLFSGTWMGTVIAWDIASQEPLYTLDTRSEYLLSLVVSPSGERLATVSYGDVFVWDLNTGESVLHITLPYADRVGGFSPDSQTLYISDWIEEDGKNGIRALTLDVDTLSAIAKSRLTRGLTDDECRRYRIDPCPVEQ